MFAFCDWSERTQRTITADPPSGKRYDLLVRKPTLRSQKRRPKNRWTPWHGYEALRDLVKQWRCSSTHSSNISLWPVFSLSPSLQNDKRSSTWIISIQKTAHVPLFDGMGRADSYLFLLTFGQCDGVNQWGEREKERYYTIARIHRAHFAVKMDDLFYIKTRYNHRLASSS